MSSILSCEEVVNELLSYPISLEIDRLSQFLGKHLLLDDAHVNPSVGYGEFDIPRHNKILKGIYILDALKLSQYEFTSISLNFSSESSGGVNVLLKEYKSESKDNTFKPTSTEDLICSKTHPKVYNENSQIFNLLKVPVPFTLIPYSHLRIRINVTIDPLRSGTWKIPIICEYEDMACPEERLEELAKITITYKSPETQEVRAIFSHSGVSPPGPLS